MRRSFVALTAALGMLAIPAAASADLKLHGTAGRANPPDYKVIGNGKAAQAQWTNKQAESGKFSMLLEKSAPTADYAYAAAIVKGVEGLTVAALGNIGLSAKTDCGGGSPRFNLQYDTNGDGVSDGIAFYGCGNHDTGTVDGWHHMLADASAPDFCYSFGPPLGPCTLTDASTVTSLAVIVDETGRYYVDNVIAAGQTVGEPNGG